MKQSPYWYVLNPLSPPIYSSHSQWWYIPNCGYDQAITSVKAVLCLLSDSRGRQEGKRHWDYNAAMRPQPTSPTSSVLTHSVPETQNPFLPLSSCCFLFLGRYLKIHLSYHLLPQSSFLSHWHGYSALLCAPYYCVCSFTIALNQS